MYCIIFCNLEIFFFHTKCMTSTKSMLIYLDWEKTTNKFPRIVHQTWKSKELPDNFQKWRQKCVSMHPRWEFLIWTDEDNREFIKNHYPWFLHVYDGYDRNIKRVDAVRYFYLYHFGGVYMDMDFTCLQTLDKIIQGDVPIFGYQLRDKSSIANAFMASPPRHPFLAYVISQLEKHSNKRHVLDATGPTFLTKRIQEYGIDHVNIFEMPVIYTHEWNDPYPCTEDKLDECMNRFPSAVTTTFWTNTWKEDSHWPSLAVVIFVCAGALFWKFIGNCKK